MNTVRRSGRILPRTFLWTLLPAAACGGDPFVPGPATVAVSPASVTLRAIGDTAQLSATVQDRGGRTMPGVAVTWTSGSVAVATVDPGGLVTATGNGVVTMEASVEGASGRSEVTVAQRVALVLVSPYEETLRAFGDTLPLEALAADLRGNMIEGMEFTWSSSDASVATVDAGGLVTAVGNGQATVEAWAQGVSGFSEIRVDQRPVHVQVSPEEATLGWVGDTARLLAEATDANGYPIEDARFAWSSDRATVTVDTAGLVTAAGGNGSVPVYAKAGRAKGGALVNVELDRGVLLELYKAMGGAGWNSDRNWGTDEPLDAWYGVRGSGYVRGLALRENGLTGSIPPETAGLVQLELLALEDNSLTGSIPPEIGRLSRLDVVVVSDNRLSGPIPPEFGNLERLVQLDVSGNRLTGAIPSELGDLERLGQLDVSGNRLTGAIPSELGDLERLGQLDVSGNQLIGPVPPEIGNLGQLKILRVNDTLLSGRLPLELIGLPLEVFNWDGTDLCAPDDEEFREWLKSIRTTSGPDC